MLIALADPQPSSRASRWQVQDHVGWLQCSGAFGCRTSGPLGLRSAPHGTTARPRRAATNEPVAGSPARAKYSFQRAAPIGPRRWIIRVCPQTERGIDSGIMGGCGRICASCARLPRTGASPGAATRLSRFRCVPQWPALRTKARRHRCRRLFPRPFLSVAGRPPRRVQRLRVRRPLSRGRNLPRQPWQGPASVARVVCREGRWEEARGGPRGCIDGV